LEVKLLSLKVLYQRHFLVRYLRRGGRQRGQPSRVILIVGEPQVPRIHPHIRGQPLPLCSVPTSRPPSSLTDRVIGDRLEALNVPAVAPRPPLLVPRPEDFSHSRHPLATMLPLRIPVDAARAAEFSPVAEVVHSSGGGYVRPWVFQVFSMAC
jgi:hypothetical protein